MIGRKATTLKRARWIGYAITILAEVGLTAMLRLFRPDLPLSAFLIPYVLLIMAIAYLYGEGPTALALVIGLYGFSRYFVSPYGNIKPLADSSMGYARISVFLLGTSIVGFAAVMMRKSRQSVELIAEELNASNQRLELLSDISGKLLLTDVPQQIIESLCRRVIEYLDCQMFFNYLVDEENQRLRLNVCAGISEETAKEIEQLELGASICGCVVQDGKMIVIENVTKTSDPRAAFIKSVGLKAYACHPLLAPGGRVLGTLAFGSQSRSSFTSDDLSLMRTFADQTATAMERVILEKHRQELYDREHHIAQTLQRALIPENVPNEILGCKIAVRYQPALREAEIGGDFYDIFELEDGKIGILIGDVAGKGLPAAVRVAAARYAIRSYAYLDPSPAAVITLTNETLSLEQTQPSGMLTAFFAIMDTQSSTMTYANAGHEPPILYRNDGTTEELQPTGMVLGVLNGQDYSESSVTLEPGEKVLMMTDGITEARQDRFRLFGKAGVFAYLPNGDRSPEEVASGLLKAAKDYAGGNLQDDVAIVVFETGTEVGIGR